jgi:hypothetical protein
MSLVLILWQNIIAVGGCDREELFTVLGTGRRERRGGGRGERRKVTSGHNEGIL